MATAEVVPEAPQISYEELSQRLRDPTLTIIDVLAEESYRNGHIPGAISLPLADLPQLAAERLPDRQREMAVYCNGPT